jgi:FdhD protein
MGDNPFFVTPKTNFRTSYPPKMTRRQLKTRIHTFDGPHRSSKKDFVAGEEPLEVRLKLGGETLPITVTMRTAGQMGEDFELAAGLLFSEGIVRAGAEIQKIAYCNDVSPKDQHYNIVTVELNRSADPDLSRVGRNFASTSSCGLCGKAALQDLRSSGLQSLPFGWQIQPQMLYTLPDKLRLSQTLFDHTGGIHAAALFDLSGKLLVAREDIGRHNAVDKVIGWALLNGTLERSPRELILLVSARAGFEIVQKCVVAQIPLLAAVSAPSSLGVELAREFDLTLVGFLRGERMNVYSGIERFEESNSS